MLCNYFKIAFRSIVNNKIYSAIEIAEKSRPMRLHYNRDAPFLPAAKDQISCGSSLMHLIYLSEQCLSML